MTEQLTQQQLSYLIAMHEDRVLELSHELQELLDTLDNLRKMQKGKLNDKS